MTFNWPHFLTISRLLNNYADSTAKKPEIKEAAYRSAVGRAYYSAFGYSFEYAENFMGFHGTRLGEDHKGLREWYKNKNHPKIKRKLLDLWKMRRACDYDMFVNDPEIKAQSSIQLALDLIKEIDQLPRIKP